MPSDSDSFVTSFHMFPTAKKWFSPLSSMWQGAIDLLLEVYKQAFNKMGGYIVSTEKVHAKSNYINFIDYLLSYVWCTSVATKNS